MAISTSVAVRDNMSAAFMNITNAINVCLNSFVDLQQSSAEGLDSRQMAAVTNSLSSMNRAAVQFSESLNETSNSASRIHPNIDNASRSQRRFNNELNSGSSNANSLFNKIKGLIGAYAGWKAGEKALDLADSMTNATARIDMMNDGVKSTKEVMDKIYASSQNARGSFLETANVVARLGNNAKDAFSSTDEIISFANLVQKQFVIAGASTNEASNAMLQLTQALGSGVLRGDELNSIFEQAPNLVQNIADYMGVPIGKIREMASEGEISADIVKNAMFASTDKINKQFDNMPVTFSQAFSNIKNSALVAFHPLLSMLSSITSSSSFQTVASGMTTAFQTAANIAQPILQGMVDGASWVVSNWGMLEPIVYGVVGAIAAYNTILGISKMLEQGSIVMKVANTIATLANGAALILYGMAIGSATIMQAGFNMVLNACPLILIATLIGIVIMAIARWVKSVGGIKIAWMICQDVILTSWERLKLVFTKGVHAVQNSLDKASLVFEAFKIAVSTVIGNTKVNALTLVQSMVNGIIDMINGFIKTLNKIPGVSIDVIQYTATFATEAAAEEAEKQAANAKKLADSTAKYNKKVAERSASEKAKADKIASDHENRQKAIKEAQADAKKGSSKKDTIGKITNYASNAKSYDHATGNKIADNTGKTADNTKNLSKDLTDKLEWMKDIHERQIIDRTVFRDIKVNLGGVKNTVNNQSDLNGLADYLGNVVAERMQSGAEGVY